MFTYHAFLLGMGLPLLVSAAILLGCRLLGRRGHHKHSRPWGQPVALGAGYVIGHAAMFGWPPLRQLEGYQWIFYFAILAVALGLVDAFWIAPLLVRWVMRLLLSGFVVVRLLLPLMQQEAAEGVSVVNAAAVVAVMLAFWINLSLLAEREPGAPFPASIMMLTLAECLVVLLSGSIVQGHVGCVIWAALTGSLLAAGRDPNLSLTRGGLPVIVVLLSGLLIDGLYYSEVPLASALLLAAAPLGLWVLQLAPVKRLTGVKGRLIGIAAVLIPLAIAVAVAIVVSPSFTAPE
jgi:hypothetical protein